MAAAVNNNAASTGEVIGSPRSPTRRTLVAEIGYEVDSSCQDSSTEAQPEVSENKNGSKKTAWNNKHYNAALDTALVMGAVSWPTLSESTKPSPKPDSINNPNDSPISQPQVTTSIASSSLTAPPPPQKPVTSNPIIPNPSTTQHQGRPARQKSTKREAAGNSSSNRSLSHHYTQSTSIGDPSYNNNNSLKTGSGVSDSSPRDHGNNNAARDGGQRTGQQRNYRRSNSGPHLRGDGSFGARRDQDHGNHDWDRLRSFNGRDLFVPPPPRVGPSGFIRPSTSGGSAYVPPPIQPYGGPMSFQSEMQPLYYFAPHPGMPFIAQMPPAVYYPVPDPELHAKIINQIDYYFSNENLVKDIFLRQNMDEHGWVPVQLIANFKKVMLLTTDIQLILDAVRASTVVEIQGDKIRRRDDWNRWTMPPSVQFPTAAGSQDTLSAHIQGGLSLDENTANYSISNAGVFVTSLSSADTNGQPDTSKQGSSGY